MFYNRTIWQQSNPREFSKSDTKGNVLNPLICPKLSTFLQHLEMEIQELLKLFSDFSFVCQSKVSCSWMLLTICLHNEPSSFEKTSTPFCKKGHIPFSKATHTTHSIQRIFKRPHQYQNGSGKLQDRRILLLYVVQKWIFSNWRCRF